MTTKQLPISIPVGIARPPSVVGADAMLLSVKRGIAGLKERIAGMDLPTVPAAYIGPTPSFTFRPEPTAFAYDVAQAGGATSLVNYIVRSGTTYALPVIVGGNGVFLAHRFRIIVSQRLNVAASGISNIAQATVSPLVNSFFADNAVYWSTKFSCFPVQPDPNQLPGINYRWNIQDPVMGTQYSDQLIPCSAILNRTFIERVQTVGFFNVHSGVVFDGDWHEFDAPWRFDKAYQLNILWRPLTDIIQFDSSISGTNPVIGLNYDDRIGGLRNQAVSVQVEFQGERVGGS